VGFRNRTLEPQEVANCHGKAEPQFEDVKAFSRSVIAAGMLKRACAFRVPRLRCFPCGEVVRTGIDFYEPATTTAMDADAGFKKGTGSHLNKDHLTFMNDRLVFGMSWRHDGKLYYDEVPADSKDEAIAYFVEHQRGDIVLVRVDLVGPNDGSVQDVVVPPSQPFSPLSARSRLDADAEAR